MEKTKEINLNDPLKNSKLNEHSFYEFKEGD